LNRLASRKAGTKKMTESANTRRAFLAAGGAAAGGGVVAAASAQPGMPINDPAVVREIEEAFAAYDRALGANDVAALNGFFHDSPTTIRYGIAENLYGYAEIQSYRAAVTAPSGPPKRERTVISAYGRDFATVSTLSRPRQPGRIIRTMQTWVRFPSGWRIVAAHVSMIDEPK
jgi:hypothetical protein